MDILYFTEFSILILVTSGTEFCTSDQLGRLQSMVTISCTAAVCRIRIATWNPVFRK